MNHTILQVTGVTKTFPGVRALDGVDFDLRRGEVHAVVGENGAGKSTLMHILGGVLTPDAGEVRLEGRPVRLESPHAAAQHGIGVVFQELSLAPNLSVAENILANRQPTTRAGLVDQRRLHAEARRLLGLFRLDIDPRTPVKRLSTAQQQVVEILKALSQHPQVIILDEPTSSLSSVETELLFQNIRQMKAQGTAFIYISHHLPEVFAIADRVTVLRDGCRVETRSLAGLTEEDLVRRMVGRELKDVYGFRTSPIGEEYFRVEGLCCGEAVRDVSFSLRRGEILGVAGLVGSGRTDLARAVFGADPLLRGTLLLDGKPFRVRSPGEAIRRGIGYLTEDRKAQGLFLGMSVRENCVAPSLRSFAGAGGFLRSRAMAQFAEESRARFRIACPSIAQRVGRLSGGNQQKVLLAMWFGIRPRLLIADEPTRGVDVGARSDIYAHLRDLSAQGVGIVLISSDLSEIRGLSDRVLVMRAGRIVAELSREEATEEQVIASATGVA